MSASTGNKVPNSTVDGHLFQKLLSALGKVYQFYESEYKDINLDGIYGLRVSEGDVYDV
jgi:hypothetical protein